VLFLYDKVARLYMEEGYPSSEKDEEKIKKALTRK